jgi:hypothetical protein
MLYSTLTSFGALSAILLALPTAASPINTTLSARKLRWHNSDNWLKGYPQYFMKLCDKKDLGGNCKIIKSERQCVDLSTGMVER